ncbi:MAG: NADH-quinone oxidoreductase subunit NuoF [bacterium]|nr:NADH-quinone oxidoreductase subunit NuoF [bacterium]
MIDFDYKNPEKIVFKNIDIPGMRYVANYRKKGGYETARTVIAEWKPDDVIEEVKKSGLRGRGGAGFLTGLKWSFIPKDSPLPKYLICNADESEPGTFKDREILRFDPHSLIEGMIIGAYAIGAHQGYIYIRGEFAQEANVVNDAIEEAYKEGVLGKSILKTNWDFDLHLYRGAGAYICGEETALIESLEGKRGHPRNKPPFPAVQGFNQSPTIVNNVETLAAVPYILKYGAQGYRKYGTEKSAGTKLFSVCGLIKKPGVYEVPMGISFKRFLYETCGGPLEGREFKAIIPGGSSVPLITREMAESEECTMDYEGFQKVGTMLGSGGVIVYDNSVCIVRALEILSRFYAHESCGQCTPCREGTGWLYKVLHRIENGLGHPDEIDLIVDIANNIDGETICPLGDAAAWPVQSAVKNFRSEFEYHITHHTCLPGTAKY